MVVPFLLLLLLQSVPVDTKPVRIWLASTGPLARGQSVPVYVQAAQDGDLIVLHRRTDGRIEVLFPTNPAADPFVRAGTYEIRGAGDRAAWVVAEPEGTGMILAALSPDPLRFDEFVRAAAWSPDALVPSWGGADSDPAGALSDIVQRMLGAGYFNYDVVTYTVAPPVYAQQPNAAPGDLQQADTVPGSGTYPVCLDCTFIGYQEIIIAPPRFHGRRFLRDEGGICGIRAPCAEANKTHAMALAMRSSSRPAPVPTPPLGRRANAGNPSEPRRRAPSSGGAPAVSAPTQALPVAPRAQVVRRTAALARGPLTHIRYTSLSTPGASESAGTDDRRGGTQVAVMAARRAVALAGALLSVPAMARPGGGGGRERMVAGEGGGGGGGGGGGDGAAAAAARPRAAAPAPAASVGGSGHATALPGAVWRSAGSRLGSFGTRRR